MTDCSADTACESKITYLGLIQPLSKAVHRYLATFLCHQALLYSPVPVCLTLPAVGLLQLASAAGSKSENVQKPAQGKLSWTLQRGSEGAQRRYSKAATYFHLHWIPKVGCPSRLPPPGHFPSPDDTDKRSTDGSAVLCPSNVTWWQSRWQHPPPTFPGNGAFTCCSQIPCFVVGNVKCNSVTDFILVFQRCPPGTFYRDLSLIIFL